MNVGNNLSHYKYLPTIQEYLEGLMEKMRKLQENSNAI